jgi:hypothetical protein
LLLEEGRSTQVSSRELCFWCSGKIADIDYQDTTASSRAPSIKDKSTSGSAPSVKGGLPRTVPFNASGRSTFQLCVEGHLG